VNDIVNLGVVVKDLVQGVYIGDIEFVQSGPLSTDKLNAVDAFS